MATVKYKDSEGNWQLASSVIIDTGSGGGITPTGAIEITENGTHDVTEYATAEVNVPTGITPEGEIEITENGTFDVTNFASALVNVTSTGGGGYFGLIPVNYINKQNISIDASAIGLTPERNFILFFQALGSLSYSSSKYGYSGAFYTFVYSSSFSTSYAKCCSDYQNLSGYPPISHTFLSEYGTTASTLEEFFDLGTDSKDSIISVNWNEDNTALKITTSLASIGNSGYDAFLIMV